MISEHASQSTPTPGGHGGRQGGNGDSPTPSPTRHKLPLRGGKILYPSLLWARPFTEVGIHNQAQAAASMSPGPIVIAVLLLASLTV